MERQVDAIYENGVLRPLEPLDLEEQQRVRITISNGDHEDPLADLLDTAFMERCARESSGAPEIEEVRRMLSKIKGSMADVIISERDERF
jgi:predicted DNA-binding antitoxin AbrB/MazE fold protein